MLLKIFRTNNLLAPLLLLMYAIAIGLFGLFHQPQDSAFLNPSFSPLLNFFPILQSPLPSLFSKIFYLLFVFSMSIVLNTISIRRTLFTFSNYLVGLCFFLLVFSLPIQKGIHEMVLFSFPYFGFFIATLKQPSDKHQLEHFLNLGIWLGLATLVYLPGVLFVLTLPALASFQKTRGSRIWIAAGIGFFSIWIILYSIALLMGIDLIEVLVKWTEQFKVQSTIEKFPTERLVGLLTVFAITVYAVYELISFISLKRINNRRYFKLLLSHFLVATALVVVQWRYDQNAFLIVCISLSFLWANLFYYLPKSIFLRIFAHLVLAFLILLSFHL